MAGNISTDDRKMFLDRALKAADWFVNSQLGRDRAEWNADRGRFPYYYYMPDRQHVPGINWTQGRGLFVLSEAYKLTGKQQYRQAAELAVRYVAALQVMDPHYSQILGAIKEQTPQGSYAGALDGAQAASGLLMFEKAAGDADCLRRSRAFCDYLLRHFCSERGLPVSAEVYPQEKVNMPAAAGEYSCIGQCTAIPLWFLYQRTGERKYLPAVIWCADAVLPCQRSDGAFYCMPDIAAAEPPKPNHHTGRGEGDDRFILRNDDGIVVVILAAHMATGEPKYLDAAVAYADWIVNNEPHDRPLCGFPVQANNVLDIAKVAKKDYSGWVLDHLDKHLLSLQVPGSTDQRAEGGFRGEDEQDEGGIFGGTSLDYVTTRVTCYAAGTLFRLSGQGTGAGFSPFGLD